jgi:hypothetical protein
MPFRHVSQDIKLAAIRLYKRDLLPLEDILDCVGLSQLSGFHQVALQLDPNALWLQGLKEYSDNYLTSDYLGPILGSKCLVMQTTGNYLRLGPSEENPERMFQVAT